MYARFVHGRSRVLACLERRGFSKITAGATRWKYAPDMMSSESLRLPAIRSCKLSSAGGAMFAAALACVVASSTDSSVCEREKIVWVDAYGKKVPVHEREAKLTEEAPTKENAPPTGYYPYVILGYGVAGQAALRALLERDPAARVLVVDARTEDSPPRNDFMPPTTARDQSAGTWERRQRSPSVEFARGTRATALDADRGVITLASSQRAKEGGTSPQDVAFGRCLLALGSRPRPPPPGFIDPSAWADVALLGSREGVDREGLKREVEAGRSVTVVGSSWQALELACWLREGRSVSGKDSKGTCRMVFPDYAPLDHILPRYLSVALLRRLNRRHVKTIGHSSLRWVGRYTRTVAPPPAPSPPAKPAPRSALDNDAPSADGAAALVGGDVDAGQSASPPPPPQVSNVDIDHGKYRGESVEVQPRRLVACRLTDQRGNLNVLTSHSFDHLDTATHSTDRLVLAGVDVAPVTASLAIHGPAVGGGNGPAKRKRAATLEVDTRRGAVVVNAELAASSRVWVAGDMACFPSQAHGGKRVVLRSVDHAHHSGKLAGENMAAAGSPVAGTAVETAGGRGGGRYCHSPAFVGEAPLAGVRLAMVGDCDAAMPTHGFWWTNNATGLSRKAILGARGDTTAAERQPRPSGVTLRTRRTVRKDFTPLFGTGVVFYTSGPEVKGALLWGFPGEAAAAAVATAAIEGSPCERGDRQAAESPADAAAGLSARALDFLRHIMERSAVMEADLSDERVMAAWLQGLSDAAKVVAQETGLGNLQPTRRSVPGRVTSSTRRPPGTRDELMYQNTMKTSSADRRLRAAYAARIRGVSPAAYPSFSSGGGAGDEEFDPEMLEFLGYGVFDGDEGEGPKSG